MPTVLPMCVRPNTLSDLSGSRSSVNSSGIDCCAVLKMTFWHCAFQAEHLYRKNSAERLADHVFLMVNVYSGFCRERIVHIWCSLECFLTQWESFGRSVWFTSTSEDRWHSRMDFRFSDSFPSWRSCLATVDCCAVSIPKWISKGTDVERWIGIGRLLNPEYQAFVNEFYQVKNNSIQEVRQVIAIDHANTAKNRRVFCRNFCLDMTSPFAIGQLITPQPPLPFENYRP